MLGVGASAFEFWDKRSSVHSTGQWLSGCGPQSPGKDSKQGVITYPLDLAPCNISQDRTRVRHVNRKKGTLGADLTRYFYLLEFPNKMEKLGTVLLGTITS